MDQPQYVLVKLSSGESLVGDLIESNPESVVLKHPLLYQIVNIPTPIIGPSNKQGMRMREVLVFKKWCDFSEDIEVSFNRSFIVCVANANDTIVQFYNKELKNLYSVPENLDLESESMSDSSSDDMEKGISGDMNINFAFEDEQSLKNFLESINSSLENLIDDIEAATEEDDDEIIEKPMKPAKPKPRKPRKPKQDEKPNSQAKNKAKKTPTKESVNKLPYDENADPKDPRAWSDNPQDYLK